MAIYQGLLKDPPEISEEKKRNRHLHCTFPREIISDLMPFCCAIEVMCALPNRLGGNLSLGFGGGKRNVAEETDLYFLIKDIENYLNGIKIKTGMVLVTLNNKQEHAGIGHVLEQYFGFELLDNPFTNPVHNNESIVTVYGIVCSRYAELRV